MWGVVAVWYVHVRVGRRCGGGCAGGQEESGTSSGRKRLRGGRERSPPGHRFPKAWAWEQAPHGVGGEWPPGRAGPVFVRARTASFIPQHGQEALFLFSLQTQRLIWLRLRCFSKLPRCLALEAGSRSRWRGSGFSPCPGDSQPSRSSPACGRLCVGRTRVGVRGGVGRPRPLIMAAVRGLPPNFSKPYRLGGIPNTVSVHCFLLVISRRPIPAVAAQGYCGGEGGGWWTSPLGFISPGRGRAAPGSLSSGTGQRRSVRVGLSCWEHGLGRWRCRAATFPADLRDTCWPRLQGKVWSFGSRTG